MSFAVIQTGGKQYKVKASEILKIEKLENDKTKTKLNLMKFLLMVMTKLLKLGLR